MAIFFGCLYAAIAIHSLLPFRLVARGQLVKQLRVHLHERFQHVVDEGDDRLVPVLLADPVQGREHDRHDDGVVVLDQRHRVLIVPEVECPLGDLKKGKQDSVNFERLLQPQPKPRT